MARSTLVCFDWAAFKAPSLKAKAVGRHHSINSSKRETTEIHFLIGLTFGKRAPPPSGTELSNGQAAKLAVKDMMDDRPRMYDSPPTTYTYQQIVRGPFRKNAFSHSIISVHSQRAALSGAFIYQHWSHHSAEFCSEWSSVLQLNKTWQHEAGNPYYYRSALSELPSFLPYRPKKRWTWCTFNGRNVCKTYILAPLSARRKKLMRAREYIVVLMCVTVLDKA